MRNVREGVGDSARDGRARYAFSMLQNDVE